MVILIGFCYEKLKVRKSMNFMMGYFFEAVKPDKAILKHACTFVVDV